MKDEDFKKKLQMKLKLNKLLKEEGYSTKRKYVKKEAKPVPVIVSEKPKEAPAAIKKKKWTIRKNKNGQLNMKNQLQYYLDKLQK